MQTDGGVEKNLKVYHTTQRLKTERNIATSEQKESYVTYYFYGIPKEVLDNKSISILGSTSDEDWDSSYSVKAYSTYYWDKYKSTNGDGFKKFVNGTVKILNNGT